MENLRLTLKLLSKHRLYARLSNYEFYEDRIHYLGHLISDKGISVNVFVTSECIHPYILCIVPQCLFRDVSIM